MTPGQKFELESAQPQASSIARSRHERYVDLLYIDDKHLWLIERPAQP